MPGKIFHPTVYRHDQPSASDTWVVAHNLGGNGSTGVPIVDVFVNYDGELQKIIPSRIEIIDANNVEIGFTVPYDGYAVVVV